MEKYSNRRKFLKQNAMIGLGMTMPFGLSSMGEAFGFPPSSREIDSIQREVILHGRRNNQAWFEPAVGVIPGTNNRHPQVFVRATLLTGNDIGPQFYLKTDDLGQTWSNPILCQNWFKVPLENDVFEEPWFGFFYHNASKQFLAVGYTHFVQDAGSSTGQKNERHYRSPELKGNIVFSLWNPQKADFEPWNPLKLSEDLDLGIYYNGQFHEMDDGTILIPGYYGGPWDPKEGKVPGTKGVTVLRCKFDGKNFHFLEHGSIHVIEEARGLAEPSIINFRDRYFLTVRHDLRAYVTSGKDGLQYGDLKPWQFDDGEDLGNYNTQQKWLKHDDTLYLVYNRKSGLNNGVFRSRAPLFMAEVDTDRLRVRRNTERIVFPEKGARMGNFNIASPTQDQSWIITGEWLQGKFDHSEKGDRFWVGSSSINYIQYIGDLLLARVYWK